VGGVSPRGGKRPGAGRPIAGDARAGTLNRRYPLAKLEAWKQAADAAGMTLTDWVEAACDAFAVKGARDE
jgi:hypothetical protein